MFSIIYERTFLKYLCFHLKLIWLLIDIKPQICFKCHFKFPIIFNKIFFSHSHNYLLVICWRLLFHRRDCFQNLDYAAYIWIINSEEYLISKIETYFYVWLYIVSCDIYSYRSDSAIVTQRHCKHLQNIFLLEMLVPEIIFILLIVQMTQLSLKLN